MREADLRRLGHSEKGHTPGRTKTTMNATRRFAAAALAAIVFSYSPVTYAMPEGWVRRPREEGRDGSRVLRNFEFSGRAFVSSKDGITANAGMLPDSSEISSGYGIEYSDKNGMDIEFTFRASRNSGRITDVFIGAEKTVVMTENSILVTLGYIAAENETAKARDGGEINAGCVEYPRPAELAGEGLVSGVVVEEPAGNVLQLLGQSGWLRALSLGTANPTAVFEFFGPCGDCELLDAGSLAILARPGSDFVHAVYASFEGDEIRLEKREIRLFADSGEHPVPEGTPRISGNGRNVLLSFDNISFAILVGEPGNPDSVTVVSTE